MKYLGNREKELWLLAIMETGRGETEEEEEMRLLFGGGEVTEVSKFGLLSLNAVFLFANILA